MDVLEDNSIALILTSAFLVCPILTSPAKAGLDRMYTWPMSGFMILC